jgi:hypothetical protein
MPSSVLLAILVGAGVLVLMPALIRRYDAAQRSELERSVSAMRLLDRSARRKRRETSVHDGPEEDAQSKEPCAQISTIDSPAQILTCPATRRRRVLLAIITVAIGFIAPAILVSPAWWIPCGVTILLASSYLIRTCRIQRVLRTRQDTARAHTPKTARTDKPPRREIHLTRQLPSTIEPAHQTPIIPQLSSTRHWDDEGDENLPKVANF